MWDRAVFHSGHWQLPRGVFYATPKPPPSHLFRFGISICRPSGSGPESSEGTSRRACLPALPQPWKLPEGLHTTYLEYHLPTWTPGQPHHMIDSTSIHRGHHRPSMDAFILSSMAHTTSTCTCLSSVLNSIIPIATTPDQCKGKQD